MQQKSFITFYNQGLFSGNYLDHHLPETSIWKENEEKIRKTQEEIAALYKEIKGLNLGPGEEATLEDKLLRPILRSLGYERGVQPTTRKGFRNKVDYALFADKASFEEARKFKSNNSRYYSYPLTILEAKYWGRRLNDSDPRDALDSRDPTAQTVRYLDDVYHASQSRIKWAILTNGKLWRLFYYHAASRSGNFYEVDLEELVCSGDLDKFKYFYFFFSKDAFLPDPATGRSWLDIHLKGSEDYAAEVSARIKELIFDSVFEELSKGFIEHRRNVTGPAKETEKSLKEIYNGCLTLLYRLLFLLYAESRGLLPIDNNSYYKKSLKKLKRDITDDVATIGLDGMSHKAFDYWSRFESLCRIVDEGDAALNVPIYNGGLFETGPGSFLTDNKISDPYLAEAIYLLTTEQRTENPHDSFIDYSSLNVRHLGDIYEGLLEFHIRVAEEEMIEVKEKGKLFWKPAKEIKETKEKKQKVPPKTRTTGDIYIENSKHERKATGSYYTPHYIVEYIVKNSVGRALKEGRDKARSIVTELEGLYAKQRRQLKKPKEWNHWEHSVGPKGKHIEKIVKLERAFYETVFDVKVLDPAMGSGHFLVHAVDFISDTIVAFLAECPDNPVIRRINEMRKDILKDVERQGVNIDETKLTEVNLIKRTVMKRCIYGVDLNEMAVELTKLSLWLDSFTLGAPLSFLDHHLKYGNSLVGSDLESLEKAQAGELYTVDLEPLKRAICDMIFVSSLSDATYDQVKNSADKYHDADSHIAGYRILLDILVSEHFGVKDARAFLLDRGTKIDLNNLGKSIESMSKKDRETIETIEKVAGEKRFFHWEIEFPEVFYERVGDLKQKVEKKENAGFDCVIGNPPYETTRSESIGSETKKYLGLYPVAEDKYDYYWFFINKGNELTRNHGYFSMIIPDTWLMKPLSKNLRRYVLENSDIVSIDTLGFSVFEQTIPTCILTMTKPMREENKIIFRDSNFNDLLTQNQAEYNKSPYYFINSSLNDDLRRIAEKTKKNSYELGKVFVEIYNGVQTGNDKKYLSDKKTSPIQRLIIRGADLDRYSLSWGGTYILWLPDEMHSNQKESIHLHLPKILIRQTADRLIATIDRDRNISLATTFVLIKDKQIQVAEEYLLAILNSALIKYLYQGFNNEVGRIQPQIKRAHIEKLPIPRITFTTPEEERKKRVSEGIGLYKKYMLELESQGVLNDERAETTDRAVADADGGGEEKTVSGKHTGAGMLVDGLRGRAGKPEDAGRLSEDPDSEHESTTRFIDSSLGIKSYSELAPHLAKGVEREMASLLEKITDDLIITSDFICSLHRDAFGELFPDWAGRYRDRNVQVGDYVPPPYYEVPVLMRQYCDDLDARLGSIDTEESLLETLAFAEGRFLGIHPFRDFNGRVARMLLFALLYRLDLPPVELLPDEEDKKGRKKYLKALSCADKLNWQPLVELWKERLGKRGEK